MKAAPIPLNEDLRIKDLHDYSVLDSPREKDFDQLVELAAQIYGCPVAYISFIDTDRQWYKSTMGLGPATQTPRDGAFCAYSILEEDHLLVEDATKDERFHDSEYVTGELGMRFYFSAPIVSSNGRNIGTVCVIDQKPRKLSKEETRALKIISSQITRLLELGKRNQLIENRAAELLAVEKQIAQSTILEQEKERAFIGKTLHEGLGQYLSAVRMQLDAALNYEPIREQSLKSASERLGKLICEVRALSSSIVPTTLGNTNCIDSISDLLEQYRKNLGWKTSFRFNKKARMISEEKSLAIFRIVEEQLKNVKEHACATEVTVEIMAREVIIVKVADNGMGIDSKNFRKGPGFNNMVTRTEFFKGSIEISPQRKKGCEVKAFIPL